MQKLTPPASKIKPEKISKLKVVLDTNILVSALLSHEGNAAKILSLFTMDALQVCYSKIILVEYKKVLSRPKFKAQINTDMVDLVLEPLQENGLEYRVIVDSVFPMQDESDRKFYDVAKQAGAFLVTGNKKHYPNEPFIVTPRYFIESVIEPLFS